MSKECLEHALELVNIGVLRVDDQGRIWRHKVRYKQSWSRITPRRAENVGGKGYLRVTLMRLDGSGTIHSVMAHRLVWTVLCGGIPDGLQINHKDLDKQNNHPDNLEVVTQSQNIRHANANGQPTAYAYTQTYRGKPRVNTNANLVAELRTLRSSGMTLKAISQQTGVSMSHISRLTYLQCDGSGK